MGRGRMKQRRVDRGDGQGEDEAEEGKMEEGQFGGGLRTMEG
jgi:hypothetical protein